MGVELQAAARRSEERTTGRKSTEWVRMGVS
jgi:hypothetical protein